MTRLVKHTATGPAKVTTPSGDQVFVCQCGLTTNQDGTCSGKHKLTIGEEDNKLYCYDANQKRQECQDCDCK